MDREFAATLMETPEPVMHAIYGEDLSVSSPSPPRSDTRTSNSVLAADRAGNTVIPLFRGPSHQGTPLVT